MLQNILKNFDKHNKKEKNKEKELIINKVLKFLVLMIWAEERVKKLMQVRRKISFHF